MQLFKLILMIGIVLFTSCRSTKNIQSAIAKKDNVEVVRDEHADSMAFINDTYEKFTKNKLDVSSFSAKINADYISGDGKKYQVSIFLRMKKDSAIWISVNGALGVEGMRVLILNDSVRILNKLDREYHVRSMDYLQELTALPFNLQSMQDLILGNPVFIDSNFVSYATEGNNISLLNYGKWFRHLLTLDNEFRLGSSKLDDVDVLRNRTCLLSYKEYDNTKGINFSINRVVSVSEKSKLDIILNFKQYEFNELLTFPFNVPKNYKRIQ